MTKQSFEDAAAKLNILYLKTEIYTKIKEMISLELVSSSHSDSDNDNDESLESQIDDDSKGDHLSQDESNVASPRFDISIDNESSSTPGILEMIIVRNVKAGAKVFNTYGSMGNVALLHSIEPDNPYDIVNIDLELNQKMNQLKKSPEEVRPVVEDEMCRVVRTGKRKRWVTKVVVVLGLAQEVFGNYKPLNFIHSRVCFRIEAGKGAAIDRLKIEIRRRSVMWRLKIEKNKGKSKNPNAKTGKERKIKKLGSISIVFREGRRNETVLQQIFVNSATDVCVAKRFQGSVVRCSSTYVYESIFHIICPVSIFKAYAHKLLNIVRGVTSITYLSLSDTTMKSPDKERTSEDAVESPYMGTIRSKGITQLLLLGALDIIQVKYEEYMKSYGTY
ncbi:hypothetical protein Tco_0688892, partial [Tanacetum coccineum]